MQSAAHYQVRTMDKNIGKEISEPYPAEKASQGEIILKRPWQRALFLCGLVAAILLPLIVFFVLR
jgi:hypothetical protein